MKRGKVMAKEEIHSRLASHLTGLGYPLRGGLNERITGLFIPEEARVMLACPTDTIPLQRVNVDDIFEKILEEKQVWRHGA